MDDGRLQDKLRRLGVVKGARKLKPAAPKKRVPPSPLEPPIAEQFSPFDDGDVVPLEKMLPGGKLVETAEGVCFVLDTVYPLTKQHGNDVLGELLGLSPAETAVYLKEPRLAELDFRDFLFIDTETTGLAGAGTLAFMVGVAFFERSGGNEVLVVRQYFLRDHGDEPAMLLLLDELLQQFTGLVSFNGRSFDLPLLDGRFLMNRLPNDLLDRPHLDLLHPARRLWRRRLGSCALGSLEESLLGVRRTHADVPGYLIPGLYHDYLRSGDGRQMARVFYHNEIDMVSMVTLATRVTRLLTEPSDDVAALDLFSLGKWQADLKLPKAEQTLRLATAARLPLADYHAALHQLGLLLKRDDRREEAVVLWQQIAATSFDEVEAHVELAKHYEWQHEDWQTALTWTEQALKLVGSWREGGKTAVVRGELLHRQARLLRKIENNKSP